MIPSFGVADTSLWATTAQGHEASRKPDCHLRATLRRERCESQETKEDMGRLSAFVPLWCIALEMGASQTYNHEQLQPIRARGSVLVGKPRLASERFRYPR